MMLRRGKCFWGRPRRGAAWVTAVCLVLAAVANGYGEEAPEEAPAGGPASVLPFTVGETLRYRLYWGAIPVGNAWADTEWTTELGRRLIAIRVRARSNRVLRRLYPVDSRSESLIDPETMLPVRFVKRLSEGRRRHHEVTYFDHQAGVAWFDDRIRNRQKSFSIEADTHDLISFMYSMRGQEFEPGSRSEHNVMADDKLYGLELDVLRKEEVRDAGGNRWEAVLVEPHATFEGLFVRKGRMFLWVSRQSPAVLVRVEVEVPIARVRAVLVPADEPEEEEE